MAISAPPYDLNFLTKYREFHNCGRGVNEHHNYAYYSS